MRLVRLAALVGVVTACNVPQEHFTPISDGLTDVAPDGPGVAASLVATPAGDIAFGDVVIGTTSGKSSVTLANTGSQPTGALALAFDDGNLGFALADDACSGKVLMTHQTCTFAVTLMPSAVGAVSTSLHISANPGGDVVKMVSGSGLSPGVVDIVDASHDFGGVNVDAGALMFVFTVRNTGQATIGAPFPMIGGDPLSYHIGVNTCTTPLGPADTCTVAVTFHPMTVGQKAGSITVSATGGGGSDSATLDGTGTAHVTVSLAGAGLVTSSQPGINCGTACDADFSSSPLTLTAQAALGSNFMGWGMNCSGTGTCLLDLAASEVVSATFAVATDELVVTKNGASGLVTSTSDTFISCGLNCMNAYQFGTTVTLAATPSNGAAFAGWSGDCSGISTCTVTMDRARNVTATFTDTTFVLSVARTGAGSGSVKANSGAINCGTVCSDAYGENAQVVLTATPDPGSVVSFTGCTSTAGNTCTVTMVAAENVTATFSIGLFQLAVTDSGTGAVNSLDGNISCGATCTHNYAFGTMVTLNAVASGGSNFDHWVGAPCDGSTSSTCMVTIPGMATSLTAVFTYALAVTKKGNGFGTVTSDVGGINCGATCNAALAFNTVVTLTAMPQDVNSTFVGWGGDCSGTASCVVTMTQAHNVSATFSKGTQDLTVQLAGNAMGTVTSNPAGISCGVACTHSFTLNQVVSLSEVPMSGATFVGWSGDCTGTGACNVTMDQARNVTATFSTGTQLLTVATGGTGTGTIASISPPGPGISCAPTCMFNFNLNQVVVLRATPAASSTFSGWTGDCTNVSGDCTVTMSQARNVTGLFTLTTKRLLVSSQGTGTGSVTPSPLGTPCGVRCWDYAFGTNIILTATPDAGSTFSGWTAPCSGTGTCAATMNADVSETANFIIDFTLVVSDTGDGTGTVTGTPGGISCTSGASTGCTADYPSVPVTNVTLTAMPMSGSVFGGWGGACAGSGTATTCLVAMSQARSVTAQFTKLFDLTATTMGSGTISQAVAGGTIGPGCGTNCTSYTSGSTVQLTAVPGSNAFFVGWTGDCGTQGTTCTLTMNMDHTTQAVFGSFNHLTVNEIGGGTVTSTDSKINCGPTCGADYPSGTMVTLNAASNPDSVFFGWSGAGCSGTGSCTVSMDMARTVTATFYFDLELGTTGGGSIAAGTTSPPAIPCTPTSGFSSCLAYAPGTPVTVTPTPDVGHAFSSWSGDCSGSGACTVTMNAAKSVTANFSLSQFQINLLVNSTAASQGTVSSTPAGITNCGSSCSASFDFGSSVTLTATPDATLGRFVKWSAGPCINSPNPVCTFFMPAMTTPVTANFDWFATMTVKMNAYATPGTRLDTVASGSSMINCTNTTTLAGTCSAGFPKNASLTLTYSGVVTGGTNDWSACTLGLHNIHVSGSGDCAPPPLGLDQTASKCMITFSARGAFTSEGDVGCQ